MSSDEPTPTLTPERQSNKWSVATIVLGVLSILVGPIFGPLAIAGGIYARRKGERLAGRALIIAIAGFVIGLVIAIALFSSRN